MPNASRSRSTSYEEYESSSYSYEESSSEPRRPAPPIVVGDRYRVGKKIGAGSYSEVHSAEDKLSGDKVAVKLEWQKAEKTNKLLNEAALYDSFKGVVGIPSVRWSGSQGEYNIMVLDLLGPSIDDLFKKRKRLSVKMVAMFAKQIIDRLEEVHDRGILYRDIKPHNFLLGDGEACERCYLVDFGLAKRYLDEVTGEHSKFHVKKNRGITGTVRYSSPNVHEGIDASRRDDLFALGYVLIHLLKGSLPWLRITHEDRKKRNELIRRKKDATSDVDLCDGLPPEFMEYIRYCRSMEFYDRPDYARLRKLLDRALTQEDSTTASDRSKDRGRKRCAEKKERHGKSAKKRK